MTQLLLSIGLVTLVITQFLTTLTLRHQRLLILLLTDENRIALLVERRLRLATASAELARTTDREAASA